jgi:MFS family permease
MGLSDHRRGRGELGLKWASHFSIICASLAVVNLLGPRRVLQNSTSGSSNVEMIYRIRSTIREYPFQFWILFCGRFIGSAGGSLVWPFMTIYLRQKLEIPLTTVGFLFAISSGVGLFSQAIWGPVVDRFGRKVAMVAGLLNEVVIMLGFASLGSLEAYAVLIAASGLIEPASRIGSDAMIADLIEPDKRAGAYALMRMISNAGVAIGPAVGGFLAATSYLLSFVSAATTASIVLLLTIFLVRETKPEVPEVEVSERPRGGYGYIFRDFYFLAFCGVSILLWIAYQPFMQILPVYMKEGFGILESGFGLIMTVNALMVVFFQFAVTRVTERYPETYVMAAGAFWTGLGALAAAMSNNFWLFLIAMVILTIGELIWAPTSITFVARVAPIDMRGRYMGVYGIVGGMAWGVGPILNGYFYDSVAPVSVWYVSLTVAMLSALAFALMGRIAALSPRPAAAADPDPPRTE